MGNCESKTNDQSGMGWTRDRIRKSLETSTDEHFLARKQYMLDKYFPHLKKELENEKGNAMQSLLEENEEKQQQQPLEDNDKQNEVQIENAATEEVRTENEEPKEELEEEEPKEEETSESADPFTKEDLTQIENQLIADHQAELDQIWIVEESERLFLRTLNDVSKRTMNHFDDGLALVVKAFYARHTGPNPLIESIIQQFFKRLEAHHQEKKGVIASTEAEEKYFRPAFDIIEKLLNKIHHQRLAIDTFISKLEEEAVTNFVATIEGSLSYPFLSTTTAFRLCLRQLDAFPKLQPTSFTKQERETAEQLLRDHAAKAGSEQLDKFKKFDKDGNDLFDTVDNAFGNGKLVAGAKLLVETASEVPVVGQFIKPLIVIGKFCYNRAKNLKNQGEDAKDLLKLLAKQVDRIARLDQLASLLLVDEEMRRDRDDETSKDKHIIDATAAAAADTCSNQNDNNTDALSLASALAKHSDDVKAETNSKVSQALAAAQLIIAACFQAAVPFDDDTNKWYEKIFNFFAADDKSKLFPTLTNRLNERMNGLVTLIDDLLKIANSNRLLRLENMLMRMNGDYKLTDEEKRNLILDARQALGTHYAATNSLSSTIPFLSYSTKRVYVEPTLRWDNDTSAGGSLATATPETLLSKTTGCSCVVLTGNSGQGKTVAMKQMAASQNASCSLSSASDTNTTKKETATADTDNNNNNNNNNNNRNTSSTSSSALPGIVIYIDLESFMKFVYSLHPCGVSTIDPLLECALSHLIFPTNKEVAVKNLKSIIINDRVPVTWLIDGYEVIAAKKQVAQESGIIDRIHDFFIHFATPQSRQDALATSPNLVRPCDRVVIAIRPEHTDAVVPSYIVAADRAAADTVAADGGVALYSFDSWTRDQVTVLSRKLFTVLSRMKLSERILLEKTDLVVENSVKNDEVTPRFVNILCQCFLAGAANEAVKKTKDLVDVFAVFLDISYQNAKTGLAEKVPLVDLKAAGSFGLCQFQNGNDLTVDPTFRNEDWVRHFEAAGLITSSNMSPHSSTFRDRAGTGFDASFSQGSPASDDYIVINNNTDDTNDDDLNEDTTAGTLTRRSGSGAGSDFGLKMFASNPEFGELLAILYLRSFPSRISPELEWNPRCLKVWLKVSERLFSSEKNNSKNNKLILDTIAEKYFEAYCTLRLQSKAAIIKNAPPPRNVNGKMMIDVDPDLIFSGLPGTADARLNNQEAPVSLAKILNESSSSGNTASPLPKKGSTLIKNSLALLLRDNHQFFKLHELCHGDLLIELLNACGSTDSIKSVVSDLLKKHKEQFPNDLRNGFPPFFLWLLGPLGKYGAVSTIELIETEFCSAASRRTEATREAGLFQQVAGLVRGSQNQNNNNNNSSSNLQSSATLEGYNFAAAFGAEFFAQQQEEGVVLMNLQHERLTLLPRHRLLEELQHPNRTAASFIDALTTSSDEHPSTPTAQGPTGFGPSAMNSPPPQRLSERAAVSLGSIKEQMQKSHNLFNQTLVAYFEHSQTETELGLFLEACENSTKRKQAGDFLGYLAEKKARFEFLEAIRYSAKNTKPLEVAIRAENTSIPNYAEGMRLACKRRSTVLITYLLNNLSGRDNVSINTVTHTIRRLAVCSAAQTPNHCRSSTVIKLHLDHLSPNLRSIGNNITALGNVAAIGQPIRQLTALEELSFANNYLDLSGVRVLTQELFGAAPMSATAPDENSNAAVAVPSLSDEILLPNLKTLDLSDNRFGIEGFWVAGAALFNRNNLRNSSQSNRNGRSRTNLILRGIQIGETLKSLQKFDPPLYSGIRKCVEEQQGIFTADELGTFIGKELPNIDKLELHSSDESHPSFAMSKYAPSIANVLRLAQNNLTHLNLTHSRVGASALLSALQEVKSLKNVQYLLLQDCALNDESAPALLKHFAEQKFHQLQTLDLSKNWSVDKKNNNSPNKALFDFLVSCAPSITELRLSDSGALGEEILSEVLVRRCGGVGSSVTVISNMKNLTTLDLSKCNLGSTEHLEKLLKQLPEKVVTLEFARCNIRIDDAGENGHGKVWEGCLSNRARKKDNNKLELLNLRGNYLHQYYSKRFQEIIKKVPGATYLDSLIDLQQQERLSANQNATAKTVAVGNNDQQQKQNHPIKTDEKRESFVVEVFENFRYSPFVGWMKPFIGFDDDAWSSREGAPRTKEYFDNDPRYKWDGDWEIDKDGADTDAEGFTYSRSFWELRFNPKERDFFGSTVKRRRHFRKYTSIDDN